MPVVLQVVGLILIAVGVLVCFGPGPALIVAGGLAVVTGAVLEREGA